jgi:hypothetical protein
VGASNEPAAAEVDGDGERDVERYERLRACAFAGEPDGHRLGQALLERRGLAAWARAWQQAAPRPSPPARAAAEPPARARELVGVLASMALACAAGR